MFVNSKFCTFIYLYLHKRMRRRQSKCRSRPQRQSQAKPGREVSRGAGQGRLVYRGGNSGCLRECLNGCLQQTTNKLAVMATPQSTSTLTPRNNGQTNKQQEPHLQLSHNNSSFRRHSHSHSQSHSSCSSSMRQCYNFISAGRNNCQLHMRRRRRKRTMEWNLLRDCWR